MSESGFERSFNWFTDRHFTLWPVSLLRVDARARLGGWRVLSLSLLTATLVVALVTGMRVLTGRPIDAFATVGISVLAVLMSALWFTLAAVAWNRRARRLGMETARRL